VRAKSLATVAQRHKKRRGVGRVFHKEFVLSAASSQAERTSGANVARVSIKKKKLKNGCWFMMGA
jgi:hypothetical protein